MLPIAGILKDVDLLANREFTCPDPVNLIAAACGHVRALAAEVEKLQAALKPFATLAEFVDKDDDMHRIDGIREDDWGFHFDGAVTCLTLGDCRRAREVLKCLR